LTVVIPVWGERYVAALERAVASVRSQDEAVPIVVVDNASEAPVPELDGTSVVRAPSRLSVGAARSLGLARVETEYVVMLDADDELVDGSLSKLREGIAADPGIAVYSMSLLEADTGARHRMPRRIAPLLARVPGLLALSTACWSTYSIQGNAIMRTDWVREAGGYPDSEWGDDRVVAVSQAFRGKVVIRMEPGLIYHAHPESRWRGAAGIGRLFEAARQVRRRLRSDPAVPGWARAMVPLIAVAQTLLIVVVRPPYRVIRAALGAARGRNRITAEAGDMVASE
jgi:glycosyltransferase involved in cell wall biosynthesis